MPRLLSGRGHGLCSCVTPPDKLFFCKQYVCVGKEKYPRLSQLVLGLEACYDYLSSLLIPVTDAEVAGSVTSFLGRDGPF